MRVIADLASFDILQEEKTPEINDAKPFNGRFALPVPDGSSSEVDSSSYILPQDGGDVASELAAALLARFPMYSNVMYNFMLEAADIADLDLSAVVPVANINGFPPVTRVVTGRGVGPGPLGQAPNTTSLPPRVVAGSNRPGLVVTDTIDIGPSTGGAGADEFLVWWYIWTFSTDHDVASDFGATAGQNNPATRSIEEMDQEDPNFKVFISNDDGATWTAAGRMEPIDLGVFNTDVRIAFQNVDSSRRYYVAAYAVLY